MRFGSASRSHRGSAPVPWAGRVRVFATFSKEVSMKRVYLSAACLNAACLSTAIVAFSILNFCPLSLAQVAGGSVSGVVKDSSGAALPAAKVTIRNTETQVTRSVAVNDDGFYLVPNLVPGNYEIAASAAGFGTAVTRGYDHHRRPGGGRYRSQPRIRRHPNRSHGDAYEYRT